MTRRLIGIAGLLAVALGTASCDNEEVEPSTPDVQVLIPATVKRMMDADFPADGEIHFESRGKFEITSDTSVCRVERDIAPSLRDSAPRFLGPGLGAELAARSAGTSAKLGGDLGNGKVCKSDGVNVVNQWRLVLNSDGDPYKLVLAVWQGDPKHGGAIWVGGVERGNGNYPEIGPGAEDLAFDRPGIEPSEEVIENVKRIKMRRRAESDMRNLGSKFVEYVSRENREVEPMQ